MDAPGTVTAATEHLREQGYEFDADVRDGVLSLRTDDGWAPARDVDVEEIHRFEGASDPGDEMIVLGVHDRDTDRRAVLVAAYGVDMDADTAACIRTLVDDR